MGDFSYGARQAMPPTSSTWRSLQEKEIAQIADDIYHRGESRKPGEARCSSRPRHSGKPTFSKRLSVQLMTNACVLSHLAGQLLRRPMKTPARRERRLRLRIALCPRPRSSISAAAGIAPWRRSGAAHLTSTSGRKVQGRQTSHRQTHTILITEGIHA